jgi:hypothetical protein
MNTLALRIDQYSAGYERGKKDWRSGGFLDSPISQLDQDYTNGYRDGTANRLFDPPCEAPKWREERSTGWWHGGE